MTPQVQMLIKIDPDMKKKVARLARQEGKTTSHIVREMIEEYIRERDISTYIDGLWDRISKKMKAKGAKPETLRKVIKEARAGKR